MKSNHKLKDVAQEIAPSGVLRVGLNMANFLLVRANGQGQEPTGIAPSMAKEVARQLDLKIEFFPYATPGELAEDAGKNVWDMALLAVEPARATVIDFTGAYLEIESSYLVPEGSRIQAIEDVDKPGVKIAVMEKSAYDLYLSRSIKHATLVRASSMDASYEIFVEQKLDALAGLKPRLFQEEQKLKGSRMLPGRFTAVQQAMGVPKGKLLAASFVRDFVQESIVSGWVQKIIDHHQIKGVSVAALSD